MEPEDVIQLHAWENSSNDWWMGASVTPIGMSAMRRFVEGTHDLYQDRQLRLMLDVLGQGSNFPSAKTIAAIDLYDFDPRQLRAGVAVHVDAEHRRQGHAREGLALLSKYAQQHLGLRQLYAEIPARHKASVGLFESAGYTVTGRRNQWIRTPDGAWEDVLTLQCLFENSNWIEK